MKRLLSLTILISAMLCSAAMAGDKMTQREIQAQAFACGVINAISTMQALSVFGINDISSPEKLKLVYELISKSNEYGFTVIEILNGVGAIDDIKKYEVGY